MNTQSGRSMVEMLGVLAIIGVLSVGAIAGYSKAMFKYKLNKQAEAFNMFLNTAIQLLPDLSRSVKSGTNFYDEFFYKANLIPEGMFYKNNGIYDIFNNHIQPMYYSTPTYSEYLIEYDMERSGTSASSRSIEICRNMVTVAKENAADLLSIQLRSGKDQTTGNYDRVRIFGDQQCTQSNTCLRNLGVKEIDDFCSSCNSENWCSVLFYIYFQD